jgi:hypothetical protein
MPDARLHGLGFYPQHSASAPVNLALDNEFSTNWSRFDHRTEPNLMSSRSLSTLILLLLVACCTAQAQPQAPTLEERMSLDEFNAAGLDRLSAEQLKFLNDWIQAKGVNTLGAPIVHRDGTTEFYSSESDRDLIESAIVGEFPGWTGNTRVTLENGQVWQQAESSRKGFKLSSPNVRIKPMSFGSWLMYVDGCSCDIRVKRIK